MRERPGYLSLLLILPLFLSGLAWADPGKELFDKSAPAATPSAAAIRAVQT